MRRKQVIGLILALAITGCATTGNPQAQRLKRQADNSWNFGQIKEGAQVKHAFTFTNETGKPLNITSVNTSCGCTVSDVDKRALAAGESAKITVKFDSKGYSGEVRQYVYIGTDNSEEPLVKFVITAEVVK